VPDNARIDQLMRGVAARTGDVACVPHFISRFESGHASPNGFDDPAGIPAENARLVQPVLAMPAWTLVSTGLTETAFTSTSRSCSPGCGIGGVISMKVEDFLG
jgi:hypothetical protein